MPEKQILEKGEVINNTYETSFFIGKGAFGEVYRVKHKLMGLQAMKIFKENYVAKSNLEDVISEGKILIRLNHKNIVKVYEINTFNKNNREFYFMTMSFVSGESLSELLKRKIYIEAPAATAIMIDVLEGLSHANDHNLIAHRDITPDNILLSYDEHKPMGILTDFGIAVLLDKLKKMPDAAGKFLYMAPESLSLGVTTQGSDVFSAGVVLYKMLTSQHPWEYDFDNYKNQKTHEEIAIMINSSRRLNPKKPSLCNETVSKELDEIILKSLEGNMENRYRSASEFLEDLKSLNELPGDEEDNDADLGQSLEEAYWKEQNLNSII